MIKRTNVTRTNVTRTGVPGHESKEYITKQELESYLYEYDSDYEEMGGTIKDLKEVIGNQHAIIKSLVEDNHKLAESVVILRSMIVTTNARIDAIINKLDPDAHCESLKED